MAESDQDFSLKVFIESKCQVTPIAMANNKILIYKTEVANITEYPIPDHSIDKEIVLDKMVMPFPRR